MYVCDNNEKIVRGHLYNAVGYCICMYIIIMHGKHFWVIFILIPCLTIYIKLGMHMNNNNIMTKFKK